MPEFSVVFYNRDFGGKLPERDVKVERYSWHMTGGPDRAYLVSPPTADKWELTKLLRCPVEIYGDDGRLNWWGYVNRVTVPYEEQRIGLGLNEMYNYGTVLYADGETTDNSDAQSVAEYGQKEFKLNDNSADSTEAAQTRDIYLGDHKYPRPEIEFTGGSDAVHLECLGWYSTLGWKYYSAAGTTSNVENTTQITSMVTASEFLNGTIIEDIANITSQLFRDGSRTALNYVNELLTAGTSNVRPLLAYVDKDRYLHVYERTQEPPTDSADYILQENGRLATALGAYEPDQHCRVAVWVQVGGVPNIIGGLSAMRPFFVESAEYDAEADKTTYRPAGAYEQIRLAKYINNISNGNYDYDNSSYYSGYYIPPGTSQDIRIDFIEFDIDQATQDDNLGVQVVSVINSRNSPIRYYDAGGYTRFTFNVTGLYFFGVSCTLVDNNYNYPVLGLFLSSAPGTSEVYGLSVFDDNSSNTSYLNVSGVRWISDTSTNYTLLHILSTGGSSTTFNLSSSRLMVARLSQ